MTKAKRLSSIRRALGWTQGQMAGAMNLDQSYLSLLETGRREISDDVLTRAHAVMDEARRLTPEIGIEEVDRAIEEMDTEALVSVFEHFVSRSNVSPLKAKLFYDFLRIRIMRQIAVRFGIALEERAAEVASKHERYRSKVQTVKKQIASELARARAKGEIDSETQQKIERELKPL